MMRRIEPLGRMPILHDVVSSGDEMVSGGCCQGGDFCKDAVNQHLHDVDGVQTIDRSINMMLWSLRWRVYAVSEARSYYAKDSVTYV